MARAFKSIFFHNSNYSPKSNLSFFIDEFFGYQKFETLLNKKISKIRQSC